MSRIVLDAGAFISVDRGNPNVIAVLQRARERRIPLVTTAPVVGQVWRNGRQQANVSRLLKAVKVFAPDEQAARNAGLLLAKSGTSDVVDALVVELCADADIVITSDSSDIARLIEAAGAKAEVFTV